MSDLEWRAPKSPLVYSPYSAERQAEELLELAQVKRLADADGGIWRTEAVEDLVPSSLKIDLMQRRLKIQHIVTLDKQALIQQGVCNADSDLRLLQLLGEKKFECRLSSKPILGHEDDEIRLKVSRYFEYFKNKLKTQGFRAEKRQALERWIDKSLQFGSRSKS